MQAETRATRSEYSGHVSANQRRASSLYPVLPSSFLSRFTCPFHRTSSSSSSLEFHFLLIPFHPTRPIFLILERTFSFLLFQLSLFLLILSFCRRPITMFSISLDYRIWFLNVAIVGRNFVLYLLSYFSFYLDITIL